MSQAQESNPMETASESAMQQARPLPQHLWLHHLLGEWTYSSPVPAVDGRPPETMTGTERFRAIGDIWVQGEAEGRMPDGSPALSQMTLGFDPARRKFVGTWLGTMMTHLWVYEGELDADQRVLTLLSEGPSMADDGTMAWYKDVIELHGKDHRTLTASFRRDDGSWQQFMQTEYRRLRT